MLFYMCNFVKGVISVEVKFKIVVDVICIYCEVIGVFVIFVYVFFFEEVEYFLFDGYIVVFFGMICGGWMDV